MGDDTPLTPEQWKELPEDETAEGEIKARYKGNVEKLSGEFQKILRRYSVPHIIQAKLGHMGWTKAMDFGDRYGSQPEILKDEGAPTWLGFTRWEEDKRLKAAVHLGQAWRECAKLTETAFNMSTPEKSSRSQGGEDTSQWNALVMAEKRKRLEQLWQAEETEDFPPPVKQPSDALIKETYKFLDRDRCPQLEWKELTLMIPDNNDDERPEWENVHGRREKTGKNLAAIPQTNKVLEDKVKLHNRTIRMVMKAFRANPQFDMTHRHWKRWEDHWFGEWIAGRKQEPPTWLLRNVHEKVWRQVRLDMETKRIPMSEALFGVMNNMMFWQTHFTEKLTKPANTGLTTKGTGKRSNAQLNDGW